MTFEYTSDTWGIHMTCTSCQTAQTKSFYGGYQADCHGCQARLIAKSMVYHQASQAKRMSAPYKSTLVSAFGDDWEAGHIAVKAEAVRLGGLGK